MYKRILVSLLIINAVFSVFPNNYLSTRLTTLNGLSQNDVHCIFQDSRKFIWISTNDGLCRYDGYEFKVYRKGYPGLESSVIESIIEDKQNNIWISSADKGIFKYDRVYDRFISLSKLSKVDITNLPTNIRKIYIDKRNSLWAFTYGDSDLFRIEFDDSFSKAGRISSYKLNKAGDKVTFVTDIKTDSSGRLFVTTTNGLQNFDYKKNEFQPIDNLGCNAIALLPDNKMVISYFNRLMLFDPENFSTTKLKGGISINSLLCSDEKIWITNQFGIYVAKYDKLTNAIGEFEVVDRFVDLNAKTIIVDDNGSIWVGFLTTGIRQYRTNSKPFIHYGKSEKIGNNFISSLFFDHKNRFWIGTLGSGLYLIPTKNGNFEMTNLRSDDYFKNKTVYAIAQSTINNDIFVGLAQEPFLVRINAESGSKSLMNFRLGDVRCLLADSVYLWIGSYFRGLYRCNLVSGALTKIDVKKILGTETIRDIQKDRNGNLWVGTDKGLCVIPARLINVSKIVPIPVRYVQDNETKILNSYTIPIYEGYNGNIWVGTLGDGLKVLSNIRRDFVCDIKTYSMDNGLSNNSIKSIIEDENDNIWISTNKGLNKIYPETGKIQVFDTDDGLQDFEFSELSACTGTNKMIYFGGVNGLNGFFSNQIKNDTIRPELTLTDFQLLNKSVLVGEKYDGRVILEKNITETRTIRLAHNQNNFSLVFAGLHYVSPKKNQYRYILDGYESNWTRTDASNRVAKYTNISPGKYVFRLVGSNCDDVWSTDEYRVEIVIDYPWWQTWYMYLLYLALIIILLIYMYRFAEKRQKEKTELVIANREKALTKELMNMRVNFFTNISHEFRTPLTLILSPLQSFLNDKDVPEPVKKHEALSTIQHNANVLLMLINQILTFSKNQQGKLQTNFRYENISVFLKEIFSQFNYLAINKNISLEYKTNNENLFIWYDSTIVEQIIDNLMSNAIKYTSKNGKIILELNEGEEFIAISVVDNGIGLPLEYQNQIFERFLKINTNITESVESTGIGLSLTKDLVEIIGGKITFESEENKGTTFTVILPKELTVKENLHSIQVAGGKAFDYKNADLIITESEIIPENNSPLKDTLLIVDDNVEVLILLRKLFGHDYDILTAENGKIAFDLIVEKMPDIVITDVMMPVMDGLELCSQIKNDKRTSHIPVILLTAKTTIENQTEGYMVRADGYCPKPFDNNLLIGLTHSILQNRKIVANRYRKNTDLQPTSLSMSSGDELFLKRLIEVIEENIQDSDLSIDTLCNKVGMQPNVLNKKLKALTNTTSTLFIRNIRLKRAAQLLSLKRYTVMEVTYEVGFNDLKHFRECFKNEFGVTPSEYKRKFEN